MWIFFCFDCLEEAVTRALPGDRLRVAAGVAEAAIDAITFDDDELRLAAHTPTGEAFALALASDARRAALRRKLKSTVGRQRSHLPALAAQLDALLEESAAATAGTDPLWLAFSSIVAQRHRQPAWN